MYDRFAITRPSYDFNLHSGIGNTFKIARGVDFSNPAEPHLTSYSAFPNATAIPGIACEGDGYDSQIDTATIVFKEILTTEDEAKWLYANFGAAYGILSLNGAISQVAYESNKQRSVYFNIEAGRTGDTVNGSTLTWVSAPVDAQEPDDEAVLQEFIGKFGTHYIEGIDYGFRISVRGTVRSLDSTRVSEFSAAFKAMGYGSASLTQGQKSTLTSSDTEFTAVIYAGRTNITKLVVTSFEDTMRLVDNIRSGQVQISFAPVRARAVSYFSTLNGYPRVKALFKHDRSSAPLAPYGVPSGTVIPWLPREIHWSDMTRLPSTLRVPEGWALCDGTNGTPNLVGRFLRGAKLLAGAEGDAFSGLDLPEGVESHNHGGTTEGPSITPPNSPGLQHQAAAFPTPAGHVHNVAIGYASHVPPCYGVLYLIRL